MKQVMIYNKKRKEKTRYEGFIYLFVYGYKL